MPIKPIEVPFELFESLVCMRYGQLNSDCIISRAMKLMEEHRAKKTSAKKLKFRPVCGGLDEAMSQVFEFSTVAELIEHLQKKWEGLIDFDFSKMKFKYQCWDVRIDWDTYFITCEGKPIGYSTGIPTV